MSKERNLPAPVQQPLPPDLVREMAMDIGKDVAAHIESMYPKAVEAASSTFLLSVRNCVHNRIIAAIDTSDVAEIERRLAENKKQRRILRSLRKASHTINPDERPDAEDIIAGRVPLEPDL